jgi:two-component system chemotaxis response regulator CheY
MALNVLVVDDSAVMRAMILKTLRLSGLALNDLHQAADGLEGLRLLKSHWIDLALVDINMPVMNGEELIEKIREIPELTDLPIVVVSTESSATRIQALRKKGAGFVHKPFTPETLRQVIAEMTGIADE